MTRSHCALFAAWLAACSQHEAPPSKTPTAATAPRCQIQQRSRVDVDHDGKLDTLLWTRCIQNNETANPRDTFAVTTGETTVSVYDNLNRPYDEQLQQVSTVPVGGADVRVLLKIGAAGGENAQLWQLIDIVDHKPRRMLAPSVSEAFQRLLQPQETLAKKLGPSLTVKEGCIEVAQPIYREGDQDCCPSAGQAKACLTPTAEGLQAGDAWREAPQ